MITDWWNICWQKAGNNLIEILKPWLDSIRSFDPSQLRWFFENNKWVIAKDSCRFWHGFTTWKFIGICEVSERPNLSMLTFKASLFVSKKRRLTTSPFHGNPEIVDLLLERSGPASTLFEWLIYFITCNEFSKNTSVSRFRENCNSFLVKELFYYDGCAIQFSEKQEKL